MIATRAQGVHGSGGVLYTPQDVQRVYAVLRGAPHGRTVEQLAQATGLGGVFRPPHGDDCPVCREEARKAWEALTPEQQWEHVGLVVKSVLLILAIVVALVGIFAWADRVQAQDAGIWEVTAYSCPPYCGFTASGEQVGLGSIAAPPWVPFGTVLCIEGIPWCGVVNDRGGAIYGYRLDVFMGSRAEAIAWGRRRVAVSRWDRQVRAEMESEEAE